jgi:AAA+ ATPase superfamily predicted ATPase
MATEAIVEFQPPGAFVKFLTETGLRRIGPVETAGDFEIYYLDLTSLKLMAGHRVPFVISKRLSGHKSVDSNEVEAVIDDLLLTFRSLNLDFFVLAMGGRIPKLSESLRKRMPKDFVAVLDGAAIEQIMPDRNKDRKDDPRERHRRDCALVQKIAACLGRAALSPYRPGTPVSGERFFGRSEEVMEAMRSKRAAGNFTYMGSRRIGKTSLLREIRRQIEARDPESVRIVDIYGSTYRSTPEVLSGILHQVFRQTEADRLMQDPDIERSFPQVIHSAAKDRKLRIAVFVDELDELLERDLASGGELMKILRATFQNQEQCRIFFAGFRRVMAEATQQKSELFNFTYKRRLRGLSRDETREMIETPLTLLGIDVHDDHVAMVYQETKGHPELIQIYCSTMLAMHEKIGRTPDADELARSVVNSDSFRQRIFGTFMSNANAFEELLTYLFIAEMRGQPSRNVDDFEFSLPEADDALRKVNVELDVADIDGLLTNLSMISITEEIDGKSGWYRFAFPALISYIESRNLEFLTRKALATLNRNLTSPQALWAERARG